MSQKFKKGDVLVGTELASINYSITSHGEVVIYIGEIEEGELFCYYVGLKDGSNMSVRIKEIRDYVMHTIKDNGYSRFSEYSGDVFEVSENLSEGPMFIRYNSNQPVDLAIYKKTLPKL